MVDFAQLKLQLNQQIDRMNQKLNAFFSFVLNKLKNFPNLTLGEQIAYSAIIAGFILILISIILFIV